MNPHPLFDLVRTPQDPDHAETDFEEEKHKLDASLNHHRIFNVKMLLENLNDVSIDSKFEGHNYISREPIRSKFDCMQGLRIPTSAYTLDLFLVSSTNPALQRNVGQKAGRVYLEDGEILVPYQGGELYEGMSLEMNIPLRARRRAQTIFPHHTRIVVANLDGYVPDVLRKDNAVPLKHKGIGVSRQVDARTVLPNYLLIHGIKNSVPVHKVTPLHDKESLVWDAYKSLALRFA